MQGLARIRKHYIKEALFKGRHILYVISNIASPSTEILHSSRFYSYFKINILYLYFRFDSYLVNTQIIF